MTGPYAEVIGDPIAQSKSPAIHNFWLGKLGIDAEYRATLVGAADLADYFSARRADPDWRGCNITMPHKQAALAHLYQIDPLAARIGAVNTVVRGDTLFVYYGGADSVVCAAKTSLSGFLKKLRKNEAPKLSPVAFRPTVI